MDSYRGFGSMGGADNPQASFVEGAAWWQGFPSVSPQDSTPWACARLSPNNPAIPGVSDGIEMIRTEAPRAADRLPFHPGYDVSDGYGSFSGFDRTLGFPSGSRDSNWDVDLRRRSGYSNLEYSPRDSGWREWDRSSSPPKAEAGSFTSRRMRRSHSDKREQKERLGEEGRSYHHSRHYAKMAEKDRVAQNGDRRKGDRTVDVSKQLKKKLKSSSKDTVVEDIAEGTGKDVPSVSASSKYFSCKICRFLTEDEAEIQSHLKSTQHAEIIKILYEHLPGREVDFIKEFLSNELKSVSCERQRRKLEPKKYGFRGIGEEHYLQRVEAAHCIACDVLIPALPELLEDHVRSPTHGQKRRAKFEKTRDGCVVTAEMLLRDRRVKNLLGRYTKGDNPFKEMEEERTAPVEDLVPEVPECGTEGEGDNSLAEEQYVYSLQTEEQQEPYRTVHTAADYEDATEAL